MLAIVFQKLWLQSSAPTTILPKDDPYRFRSGRTAGSSIESQRFRLRLGGSRIHGSGHFLHSQQSGSCPTHVRECFLMHFVGVSLQIVFRNLAAADIWEADAPCSANTALCLSVVFDDVSRGTTLPLHFLEVPCNEGCKMKRPLSFFVCRITSASPFLPSFSTIEPLLLLFFTFFKSQAREFLTLSHSDGGFGFWNFHRLYDSDWFVSQAVLEFRHKNFSGYMVHMFRFPWEAENRHGFRFSRAPLTWEQTAFYGTTCLSCSS